MPKNNELVIAIEVDDNGTPKIKNFGEVVERETTRGAKGAKEMDSSFTRLTGTLRSSAKGLGLVVAGVGASVAAVSALVVQVSAAEKELENQSRLAQSSSQDFAAWGYAVRSVSMEMDTLADISKDVSDKLGDFIATGGGELADFFENVGTRVGLTAESLQGMAAPEILIEMKKAMDELNLSYEQQVFYLESVANDATLLMPLLENGGEAMHRQAERAKELGVALSEVDHQNLLQAAKAGGEVKTAITGIKNEVAAEFAPAFTSVMEQATSLLIKFRGNARTLVEPFANLLQTVAGWEAVFAGKMGFLDFAVMDAKELAEWLEADRKGLHALQQELAALDPAEKLQQAFTFGELPGEDQAEEQLTRLRGLVEEYQRLAVVDQRKLGGDAYLESLLDQIEALELEFDELIAAKKKLAATPAKAGPAAGAPALPVDTAAISRAYANAFSSLDTITSQVYDAMRGRYQQDRDAFIALTGDKITAARIYEQQMQALAEKTGSGRERQRQQELLSLRKSMSQKLAALGASDHQRRQQALDAELVDLRRQAQGQKNILDQIEAYALGKKVTLDIKLNADIDANLSAEFAAIDQLQQDFDAKRRSEIDTMREYVKASSEDEFQTRKRHLVQEIGLLQEKYAHDEEMLRAISQYHKAANAEIDADHARHMDNMSKNTGTLSEQVAHACEGWAGNWASALNDMVWGAEVSFGRILQSFMQMITQMIIQKTIVEPLVGGFLSYFNLGTPQANAAGGIYSGAGISAYENSIVTSPTLFPFAHGTGLMGEAGPEAILPLTRMSGGNLGVEAQVATQAPVVNINIHEGEGVKTRVEEREDGKVFDIFVEQMEGAMQARISRGAGLAGFLDGRYGRAW